MGREVVRVLEGRTELEQEPYLVSEMLGLYELTKLALCERRLLALEFDGAIHSLFRVMAEETRVVRPQLQPMIRQQPTGAQAFRQGFKLTFSGLSRNARGQW